MSRGLGDVYKRQDLYVLNESKHLKHDAEELKKFHRKIMEDKEYEGNNNYEL